MPSHTLGDAWELDTNHVEAIVQYGASKSVGLVARPLPTYGEGFNKASSSGGGYLLIHFSEKI